MMRCAATVVGRQGLIKSVSTVSAVSTTRRLSTNSKLDLPPRARIIEVGPRDGLQTAGSFLSTHLKIELVKRLWACGVDLIDAAAMVHPKANPLLGDGDEVMKALVADQKEQQALEGHCHQMTALTPNMKGMERAIAAGAKDVSLWITGAEAFSKRNVNMTIDEHRTLNVQLADMAQQHGVRVRGYVSCALHCPFEGFVDPVRASALGEELRSIGCYEVSYCDTTGRAGVNNWDQLLGVVTKTCPTEQICLHIHNTYNQALPSILFAMSEYGIVNIESSVAGLGGCPYAPGASGNIGTEDVVYTLHGLGVETNCDIDKLLSVSRWVTGLLGITPDSALGRAHAHNFEDVEVDIF